LVGRRLALEVDVPGPGQRVLAGIAQGADLLIALLERVVLAEFLDDGLPGAPSLIWVWAMPSSAVWWTPPKVIPVPSVSSQVQPQRIGSRFH